MLLSGGKACRPASLPAAAAFVSNLLAHLTTPHTYQLAVVVGLAKEAFSYDNMNQAFRILLAEPGGTKLLFKLTCDMRLHCGLPPGQRRC